MRSAEPAREEVRGPVTAHGRSRKRKAHTDKFYIPESLKPAGWTYEWKRKKVYGQEDTAHIVGLMENGWSAVPAERHAGMFMPAGYTGEIERDGLVLMERPVELTEEARAEDAELNRQIFEMQMEQLGQRLPQNFGRLAPNIRRSVEPGPAPDALTLATD